MRLAALTALGLALAAPAFAQEASDTLKLVTTRGIVLEVPNVFKTDVTYTPDGKFTAMDGQITGTWKVKGDTMCTSSNANPVEECTVYPAGKKSGDSFPIGGQGAILTIK